MSILDFNTMISFLITKLAEMLSAAPVVYFVGLALAVQVIHVVLCILNYYVPKNGGKN